MSKTVFPPSNEFISKTLINKTMYEEMYEKSISDPDGFWGEVGHRVNC
jgi:acetyl-CoA synthetase